MDSLPNVEENVDDIRYKGNWRMFESSEQERERERGSRCRQRIRRKQVKETEQETTSKYNEEYSSKV